MDKVKKNYFTPSVKVVNIVEAQRILVGSGNSGTEKYSVCDYSFGDDDFE
ncbi:MAG: hypothetical protein MJY75_05295 [Bacteroidaceae bacterium]|nr:hypothetical protein [Bacteroidaceae bacterium]